ncbi:MAG: 4-hydroxy-tetrahydrodipicolinate reductase, partial [Chloroflexia bacterium]|nr:4-hydroxy-tetrahydrodipicolinate reductase [Chloroflexia bacterium]
MAVRIGVAGIRGRMGREIVALAANDASIIVVGGLSRDSGSDESATDGPALFPDAAALLPNIDVLIDFSAPEAAAAHAEVCAVAGVPFVCGTTGLDAAQMARLHAASRRVAVFHAANMSPALNAILAMLPALVRALDRYDVEIVETHHRHKVDAPSGTALALARAVSDARGAGFDAGLRHGRQGPSKRTATEIGIHAVRAGGNPGEHEVILAGDGEEIRLTHRA